MHGEDDLDGPRPDGLVERDPASAPPRRAPTSYAPAVPRLRRRLPSVPGDRRAAPRHDAGAWRGRLVDLRR